MLEDDQESALEDDQESAYEDDEYINKVLQQIQCAYLNSNGAKEEQVTFLKTGAFDAILPEYGIVYLNIDNNKRLKIGRSQIVEGDKVTVGGRHIEYSYTPKYLDYGSVKIIIRDYGVNVDDKLTKIQDYVFPESDEELKAEANNILASIVNSTSSLSADDVEQIRSISNCAIQYFTAENKVKTIKKIAAYDDLDESLEDLILDIIETHTGDYTTYANDLLDELSTDDDLFSQLFLEIENTKWFYFTFAKEDNADRFYEILYSLWKASKYSSVQHWETAYDPESSPAAIPYEPIKGANDVDGFHYIWGYDSKGNQIGLSVISHSNRLDLKVDDLFMYSPLQPLKVFEQGSNNSLQIQQDARPAFYYYVHQQKKISDASAEFSFFILESHLAVLGIAELTVFRSLSNYRKFIALIETVSPIVDLTLTYTEVCDGNEELCQDILEYNRWLQYLSVASNVGFVIKSVHANARKIVTKANADSGYDVPDNLKPAVEEYSGGLKFVAKTVKKLAKGVVSRLRHLLK